MDAIISTDLYHIIGMGELTVTQTNTFLKLIKEYMSFRLDIKTIASNLTVENIPGLPSQSEYKLARFGNIVLKSKCRGADLKLKLHQQLKKINVLYNKIKNKDNV